MIIRGIERAPIFIDDQGGEESISRMGMLTQETESKIVPGF